MITPKEWSDFEKSLQKPIERGIFQLLVGLDSQERRNIIRTSWGSYDSARALITQVISDKGESLPAPVQFSPGSFSLLPAKGKMRVQQVRYYLDTTIAHDPGILLHHNVGRVSEIINIWDELLNGITACRVVVRDRHQGFMANRDPLPLVK